MSTVKLMGSAILTAIAASLCCITPVLALIAGSGSIASSFSWISPARPYLIGLTIVVLGFAWYQKLKTPATDECGCAVDEKPRFFQSKTFLSILTLFAALMIAFPVYAKVFFPKKEKTAIVANKSTIQKVELSIKGMTCEGCEAEVNHEVYRLPGIIQSDVSYETRNAVVKFDASKITLKTIVDTINATGYKVIDQKFKN